MMDFIADLHIHSRFSRATSKDLDLERLYIGAQCKGITVLGTGDITHPAWSAEIRQKLIPAEEGLYALRPEMARCCDEAVPVSCRSPVRFLLTAEVSNIYKKNGATRKNHNLICFPNLDAVDRLCAQLAKIGNIASDGRPILGLDSRDLLEMVLETAPGACLIPAHIWTPWFSLLGSKSGFDSVEACFSDLSDHIVALETGLSSDPAMNWRLSRLDRFTLVSNSDAHSVAKIGREATIFSTVLGYPDIIGALSGTTPGGFKGTIEFFPQEGKYHLDGHRHCNQRLTPEQTRQANGLCPACQKELTLGVLNRVEQLADRPEGTGPRRSHCVFSLVPLEEILAELLQVGTGTKSVAAHMHKVLDLLGNELDIAMNQTPEAIAAAGVPLLAEAIVRVRQGKVTIQPGYDGQYGKVRIFSDEQRRQLMGQTALFSFPSAPQSKPSDPLFRRCARKPAPLPQPTVVDEGPNPEQRAALSASDLPLMIVAGPGTGKTFTLILKIADLICRRHLPSRQVAALTFTQKAAREMRQRLEKALPRESELPLVTTFHGFCLFFLQQNKSIQKPVIVSEQDRLCLIRDAVYLARRTGARPNADSAARFIEAAKQRLLGPEDDLCQLDAGENLPALTNVYGAYQELLMVQGLMDYEDLVFQTVKALDLDPRLASAWQKRFTHIFVDEYQDINLGQQRLIHHLSPQGKNLCVIGDPDQSIYGFRGSQPEFFLRFTDTYPHARRIGLTRNYRSAKAIVDAAGQVMANHRLDSRHFGQYSLIEGIGAITVLEAAGEKAEAVMIGKTIEKMVGGTGFLAIDSAKVDPHAAGQKGFGDFAVISRTHDQLRVFADVFTKAGIPFETTNRRLLLSDPFVAALISWLRVVQGQAGFIDLQRAAATTLAASVFSVIRAWSLQNRWDVATAMAQIRRFPLPGVTLSQQKRICLFFDELQAVAKGVNGLCVPEQLCIVAPMVAQRLKMAQTDHLETMRALALHHADNLSDFLSSVALLNDTDLCRLKGERVSLLTMHAAKGMEFDVVFIAGAEDGLCPLERSDDIAEERRLFYVAMTRARQNLFICHSRRRQIFGQNPDRRLSAFVADIDPELVDRRKVAAKPQKAKGPEQRCLF